MVEQAEVLKHDANAAAKLGAARGGKVGHVLAENEDQASRRAERHEQEAQ